MRLTTATRPPRNNRQTPRSTIDDIAANGREFHFTADATTHAAQPRARARHSNRNHVKSEANVNVIKLNSVSTPTAADEMIADSQSTIKPFAFEYDSETPIYVRIPRPCIRRRPHKTRKTNRQSSVTQETRVAVEPPVLRPTWVSSKAAYWADS